VCRSRLWARRRGGLRSWAARASVAAGVTMQHQACWFCAAVVRAGASGRHQGLPGGHAGRGPKAGLGPAQRLGAVPGRWGCAAARRAAGGRLGSCLSQCGCCCGPVLPASTRAPAPAALPRADLFNWATGKGGTPEEITRVQAMECARRPQGRSWEVLYDKLMALGAWRWALVAAAAAGPAAPCGLLHTRARAHTHTHTRSHTHAHAHAPPPTHVRARTTQASSRGTGRCR
jgi:ABC-type nickel/cobalt efflux system permease component RcnA